MTTHQQHRYLQALGIPVWVQRSQTGIRHEQLSPASQKTPSVPPGRATILTEKPALKERINAPAIPVQKTPVPDLHPITTLDALAQQAHDCRHCRLSASRHQVVFATGKASAHYMVIGDAPSSDEDRQGHALAGSSGTLLRHMLAAIQLPPDAVYLTHTIKCRPPNDRAPAADEQRCCQPYLEHQIKLLKPKAILILGRTAAQHLLQQQAPLSTLRNDTHTLTETQIPAVVTYHPRNLLRQPTDKRKAWEDLKQFRTLCHYECTQ